MDEDIFMYLFEADEEDCELVQTVYRAGKFQSAKDVSRDFLDTIIKYECSGVDPENLLSHLKKYTCSKVAIYDDLLDGIKEKLANEF